MIRRSDVSCIFFLLCCILMQRCFQLVSGIHTAKLPLPLKNESIFDLVS